MPVRLTRPSFGVLCVELLAGLVVALALIPEAISSSLIAGVDPRAGLFASFTMAVTIALAILIFLAQLPHLTGGGALGYALVAGGLALIFVLPRIIAPYSFTLAIVGLLESLMTAKLVDDIAATRSDKERAHPDLHVQRRRVPARDGRRHRRHAQPRDRPR